MNYDSSKVGVPYIRAHRIIIEYPTGSNPRATILQSEAVRLADGTVRQIGEVSSIVAEFDFALNATNPIPLVHPDTGEPLGADTNLQTVFLNILAVVRQLQKGA